MFQVDIVDASRIYKELEPFTLDVQVVCVCVNFDTTTFDLLLTMIMVFLEPCDFLEK